MTSDQNSFKFLIDPRHIIMIFLLPRLFKHQSKWIIIIKNDTKINCTTQLI